MRFVGGFLKAQALMAMISNLLLIEKMSSPVDIAKMSMLSLAVLENFSSSQAVQEFGHQKSQMD